MVVILTPIVLMVVAIPGHTYYINIICCKIPAQGLFLPISGGCAGGLPGGGIIHHSGGPDGAKRNGNQKERGEGK